MAHDEHAARLCDELGKGRGHHTGFDLRAALRLLGAPAEEREVIAVLDDGLIAAAGQRHFNGKGGKIVVLAEIHAVLADAD